MTEYGTIKIPRDEYERHNDRRKELGVSWCEYINGQAPQSSSGAEVDLTPVLNRLDDLETELSTQHERMKG